MTKTKGKELAERGQEAAARYLYKRGYEILEQNWKCKAGEIDIIARDDERIVFVDVKTRQANSKLEIEDDKITSAIRKRFERMALNYLTETEIYNVSVCYDVIAITVLESDRALIRHHINALCPDADM